MAMLLPRLKLTDATVSTLKAVAQKRGVSVSEVIAELIEGRLLEAAASDRETLFRILLAGEKAGVKVVGATQFPVDWYNQGGLPHEVCRKVAADYSAWKQVKSPNN